MVVHMVFEKRSRFGSLVQCIASLPLKILVHEKTLCPSHLLLLMLNTLLIKHLPVSLQRSQDGGLGGEMRPMMRPRVLLLVQRLCPTLADKMGRKCSGMKGRCWTI